MVRLSPVVIVSNHDRIRDRGLVIATTSSGQGLPGQVSPVASFFFQVANATGQIFCLKVDRNLCLGFK